VDRVVGRKGGLRIEPYLLVPVARCLRMRRPRLLVDDAVGLGKPVAAGLIVTELIAHRQAIRVLIVTPDGPKVGEWEGRNGRPVRPAAIRRGVIA
jgi:hypothetical protein